MSKADVISAGGIDNKTLQSAIEGTRRSGAATRSRIESALGLEPGTLNRVERGEMPAIKVRRRVSDTELIAMLADRLAELRAENDKLRAREHALESAESSTEASPFNPRVVPPEPNEWADRQAALKHRPREMPHDSQETVGDDD